MPDFQYMYFRVYLLLLRIMRLFIVRTMYLRVTAKMPSTMSIYLFDAGRPPPFPCKHVVSPHHPFHNVVRGIGERLFHRYLRAKVSETHLVPRPFQRDPQEAQARPAIMDLLAFPFAGCCVEPGTTYRRTKLCRSVLAYVFFVHIL